MPPLTKLPEDAAIQPWLRDALNSVQEGGSSLYVEDRNRAFEWHSKERLPVYDYTDVTQLNVIRHLALDADQKSVWNEAWACYHQALVGCAVQENRPVAVEVLWRLGRAHLGLTQYPLSELYLRAAESIPDSKPDKNLQLRIMMDHAVLTALSKESSALDKEGEALASFLSQPDSPNTLETIAKALFNEGSTNDRWEKNGVRIPSCQRHAAGLYLVSIWLNKKVNNRRAIAIMLVNLGNVWINLAEREKAAACWQELQPYISDVSSDPNTNRFKDGLKKLQASADKKWWHFWK